MKKCSLLIISVIFFLCCVSFAFAEEAPQKIKDLAQTKLAAVGKEPVIVAAVKAENAKGKSLDQIKRMDEKWRNTPGLADSR